METITISCIPGMKKGTRRDDDNNPTMNIPRRDLKRTAKQQRQVITTFSRYQELCVKSHHHYKGHHTRHDQTEADEYQIL